MKKIKITKKEAAERQLALAIDLFFNDGDPIAIHTLIGASEGILRALCKKNGLLQFIGEKLVKPERKKEFYKFLHHPKNYLKHADNDGDDVLEFSPEVNAFFILNCLDLYSKLEGKVFGEGYIFILWYVCNHPDTFINDAGRILRDSVKDALSLGGQGVDDFRKLLNEIKTMPRIYYPMKVSTE